MLISYTVFILPFILPFIYLSFHPFIHPPKLSLAPSQLLSYFHLLVLLYSASYMLNNSLDLLPSPNRVYIRGRMVSLKIFPNSFCQDNYTGKATEEGVRSGGCRWSHWSGPYSNSLAKRCNMMISISVIMSCFWMRLSWSTSAVVLLLNKHRLCAHNLPSRLSAKSELNNTLSCSTALSDHVTVSVQKDCVNFILSHLFFKWEVV